MKNVCKLVAVVGLSIAGSVSSQSAPDALKDGFKNPPASARPRVWWHWMNGNITKEGIKLDLEWMHRVGLAGFQNFDAALGTPQVVKQRLAYMTPEWKDAFRYAITTGDRLGMEMAIAGSPGWSESGGPWVPPSHGMKKYAWSETLVEGGKPFSGMLPAPPSETGAFQNQGSSDFAGPKAASAPKFYADVAVVAYRKPKSETALLPKITASGDGLDTAKLSDGDLVTMTGIPVEQGDEPAWIQYEFAAPQAIRAVTYVAKEPDWVSSISGNLPPERWLQASDDGKTWRKLVQLNGPNSPEHTVSFAPVTARLFRVTFKSKSGPADPNLAAVFGGQAAHKPKTHEVAELVLHSGPRVNHWEEKAAFSPVGDLYEFATPQVDSQDAIAKSDVIDLTGKMTPEGKLDWNPPAGDWVVMRMGYSLLGITNHPATPEATGLEVDKLDRRYVREYFEKYLDSYKETVGAGEMGAKGIQYVINDSWEAGAENWTDAMLAQFKKLRGYDLTPWLPVLAGHVVESAEASDRFLWDFRKTIADLTATEHYAVLEDVLHERGMKHYGESHEGGRALIADGMEVKKYNEIPMSAMWTQSPGVNNPTYGYNADDRESASVAHIYGQNLAAAESMTAAAAPWGWSPATLKPTADQEFLNGINRFVIHESAHQPLSGPKTMPGLTLGPFGQWFNRNETWAEQAGAWIDYLARTSFLLQQGRFHADLLYFYGEDSNLTAIYGGSAPAIPAGYGFDYINADALMHELHVSNGALATHSGMEYKILALAPYSTHMSLPVLKAIRQLVQQGAAVVGARPTDDPSQTDNQAEFKAIADELFGDGTGVHAVGKGKVYAGQDLATVLTAMKIAPDFDYTSGSAHLEFVHRRLKDGDVYFVDNRSDQSQSVTANFRVTGKQPELWYAETATSKPASFTIANGRTSVPLKLEPWGTVFVVFRKNASANQQTIPNPTESKVASIDGPWKVSFQQDRGAPESINLDKLASWTENSEAGVKYYSGIGTYTRTVDAPAAWFKPGAKMYVDLGDVKELAEVTINGRKLGVVWHAPFRVEVTHALKPGANQVEIKVANLWVNRLIGDEQPGAEKYTSADVKPYKADSPLLPSGLLGPVEVVRIETR